MAPRQDRHSAPYRASIEPGTGRGVQLLLILTTLVAFLAVGPVVWGIVTGTDSPGQPTSAFAAAPAGQYAVVSRVQGPVDVVSVVGVDRAIPPIDVAQIPHLDGFETVGAVDPRGRYVALVAVDSGTPLQPTATLLLLDLQSGSTERLVTGVDAGWRPLWNQSGTAVLVTRTRPDDGGGVVDVFEVALDGSLTLRWSQEALAVYPLGWQDGRSLSVAIDARGSTLQADGQDLLHLANGFTRDWSLAPDGQAIAFVETTTAERVRYIPRVLLLAAEGGAARAQALSAEGGEALGAVWSPDGTPRFGDLPRGSIPKSEASAQSLSVGGFDIPLGYSPDGSALAVVHWDGTGFDDPGTPTLHLLRDGQRLAVPGYRGFFGWTRR